MPYLLNAISVSDSKCDNLICQKGFVKAASSVETETQVNTYFFKGKSKREKKNNNSYRKLTRSSNPVGIMLKYETDSPDEFKFLRKQLASADYWIKSADTTSELYQFRDTEIETQQKFEEDTTYEITVQRKLLPAPRNLLFADDLLVFNSHENLLYVFGENNVRKDRYFFSDDEFSPCTVLYPNTSRQAVFIWKDEKNLRNLSQVIIGGQLMIEGLMDVGGTIPENIWRLESGVRTGMSLQELKRLHGAEISFYGGSSRYAGKIIPSKEGSIDFEKNGIILDCLNCHSSSFVSKAQLSADEALKGGMRFFIFCIILVPGSAI